MGNLFIDLLLYGAAKQFNSLKNKYVAPPALPSKGDTSMECLAFDALHEQQSQVKYKEQTGDVYRDIEDDGGPNW